MLQFESSWLNSVIISDYFYTFLFQVEETKGLVCMVVANKQDLANSLSCEEIERRFRTKYGTTRDHSE